MNAVVAVMTPSLCDRLTAYGKQFDALSPSRRQEIFRSLLETAGIRFHRLAEAERRTHLVVQRAIYATSHLCSNPHLPYERLLQVAVRRFLREVHGGRYARTYVANPEFKTIFAKYHL